MGKGIRVEAERDRLMELVDGPLDVTDVNGNPVHTFVVYPLPSREGDPLVPVDVDVLLWCGRWVVGRLVQYGRYVGREGVLNPVAWTRLPPVPQL